MSLSINGFHDLTSANEGLIIFGKRLKNKYSQVSKKHIVALNRLAAIANMPETQELSTAASITQFLLDINTSQNTLLVHRKIRNSSFTGLRILDTYINTLAHHMTCPLILQALNLLNRACPPTQHLQHNHAQQHTIGIL
jgi:hypothetical protein